MLRRLHELRFSKIQTFCCVCRKSNIKELFLTINSTYKHYSTCSNSIINSKPVDPGSSVGTS